jgi:translation initiation factor 1
MGKKIRYQDDIVYSTERGKVKEAPQYEKSTLAPEDQLLELHIEKKGRGGKVVIIVKGFVGKSDDLKDLGKTLKSHCGVGGTNKNGTIEIQGDVREKIDSKLKDLGYKTKRVGG